MLMETWQVFELPCGSFTSCTACHIKPTLFKISAAWIKWIYHINQLNCLVGWVKNMQTRSPPKQRVSWYDINLDLMVRLQFWRYGESGVTLSLPLLLGRLCLRVVVLVRVSSMGQIELMSWVWYKTASVGDAPVLEIQGVWSHPFVAITPRSTVTGVVVPVWVHLKSNRSVWKLFIRGVFNKFLDFFVQAFKIAIDSWKFSILLLYILWDDWPILMISASNEQLQQQLEYTLL